MFKFVVILLYVGSSFIVFGDDSQNVDQTLKVSSLEKNEELLSLNAVSRLNWAKTFEVIYISSVKGELKQEDHLKLLHRSLAYEMALFYENSDYDVGFAYQKLKEMHRDERGADMRNDPLILKKFFDKNPDDFCVMINLNKIVVGNSRNYESFCKWFKEQVTTKDLEKKKPTPKR